jgi:hypothetical protein
MTRRVSILIACVLACAGCAAHRYDYTEFREHFPTSILVAPPINLSRDPEAPNTFLASIAKPLADRGYYAFPVPLAIETLDSEGLSEPAAIRETPPEELHRIFAADAVLYATIEKWSSQTIFLSVRTEIAISYVLKDARTGITIWEGRGSVWYEPQDDGSLYRATNDFSLGIAAPWRGAPYLTLADEANRDAIDHSGRGLPFGKYNPRYGSDLWEYPAMSCPVPPAS